MANANTAGTTNSRPIRRRFMNQSCHPSEGQACESHAEKQKAIAKRKKAQVIEEAERAHDKTLREIEAPEAELQKERASAGREFERRVRKTKQRT